MNYLIKYYNVTGDSVFAAPSYTNQEVISCKEVKQLDAYLSAVTDNYGFKFRKEKAHGFDWISKQGALKVEKIIIKKLY